MKIIEQNIFYTLLRNGRWDIHAPIWKNEGSGVNYANKTAEEYSCKETPISGREFKPTIYEVVEIDVTKLKVIYKSESKDLRKRCTFCQEDDAFIYKKELCKECYKNYLKDRKK